MKNERNMSLGKSLFVITVIFSIIVGGYTFADAPLIGIFFMAFITLILLSIGLGFSYEEIESAGFDYIKQGLQPFFILMGVGGMVGTWMASGTIASLIYFGLKTISPQFFLLTTLILCSVTSISTGTSWGSMATAGVAMMGVGESLGMPAQITAAAVICGSFFGDKMSPFSDTTNITAAVTGIDIMTHIKHMAYEQIPSYIITSILFTIIGFKYRNSSIDYQNIERIMNVFDANFNIGIIAVIPAIVVLILLLKKVPALLSLVGGGIAGGFIAIFYQGRSLTEVMEIFHGGFFIETGFNQVDMILNRGGMVSMYDMAILIMFAIFIGGVLKHIGVMNQLIDPILRKVKSEKSLIVATMVLNYLFNAVVGSFSLAAVMTSTFMLPMYEHFKLRPENLSRVIEACGTYGGVLMPWDGHAIYAVSTLGVPTSQYWPYCFLNFLSPIITLFYGLTGITMTRYEDVDKKIIGK